ncbi:MAG: transcriptional repressor [Bacteroidota bacterium]
MGIIRKTKSVKALLNEFEQTETAISALELVERLRYQMNKSTVYRILERLEDDGIVHSFTGRDGLTWYALYQDGGPLNAQHLNTHPHFQCRECGKTQCLPINIPIPEVEKHNVESVSLLLVGKCEDCVS